MIVADTSALMAIVLGEPIGKRCCDVLADEATVLLSAGTLAEALIVAERRGQGAAMRTLVETFAFDVSPVTATFAAAVARAYARWGKGRHPARLNFGDCFAYALASGTGCPLLFVGEDFEQTDVENALARR